MKIKLLVELEYDARSMHGDDPEAIEWFHKDILKGTDELLILHSNELGDEVGTITVLEVQP